MTTAKEPPSPAVPPPCSPENPQQQDASKDSTNNFNRTRCQFTYSDGRQCRNPAKVYQQDELSPVKDRNVANERAPLCLHHGSKQRSRSSESSALELPELQALCADLTTATSINRALAQTYLLMAQGRISRKDAVAFGYLTQLLLQTVPGVRAEFVAAYGYQPWEERLKAGLERSEDDHENDPPLMPLKPDVPAAVILSESARPDERRISPKKAPDERVSKPVKKAHLTDQSVREGLTDADMESLDARTEDLFAGKYDVTPEGRREARVLEYEIELLKPARIKPAKGRVGQVASVVRRVLDAEKRDSAAATEPPSPLNYYGQPIKPGNWWHSLPGADPAADPGANPSAEKVSAPLQQSSAPEKKKASPPAPAASAASSDSTGTVVPNEPAGSSTSAPFARPAQDDPLDRKGHTTDWHAPASWSGRAQPDPYPSRYEKLRRRFRSLSPSALRRVQHHNSRGFWSPEIRNLVP